MNREIKFRAWDKIRLRMYYDVWFDASHIYFGYDEESEKPLAILPRFSSDLMQFTGLKDKNGKEIWEGDIVKCNKTIPEKYDHHGRKGLVVYRSREAQFVIEDGYGMAITSLYAFGIAKGEDCCLEIIGNFYENPELLNN